MVKRTADKKGFSIAEALVSMLVVSVFFLATSKVMTQKQPRETQETIHGFYECYVKNEDGEKKLKQRRAIEQSSPPEQSVTQCELDPPSGIAFAIIYAIAGTADDPMEGKNKIYRAVEPQFNKTFTIASDEKLRTFHSDFLMDVQADSLDWTDVQKFLELSYPHSGLLEMMKNGEYDPQDPALFVGW